MAAVGILVAMAHLSMVQAFKYVEVSSMEPFVFMRLVWAAGIGYVAFQEFPGPWTWAGAAIIVAASSYIARREAKAHASTISLPHEIRRPEIKLTPGHIFNLSWPVADINGLDSRFDI